MTEQVVCLTKKRFRQVGNALRWPEAGKSAGGIRPEGK